MSASSLLEALGAFDGKRADTLAAIADAYPATADHIQLLCELATSDYTRLQSASTWLLKRMLADGSALSPAQTELVLAVLLRECHWEARLHVLQMMADLSVPDSMLPKLWNALRDQLKDTNKFIRAWAYYGSAVIADQHPAYRDNVQALLVEGAMEEAASVRARLRRIRKAFKWIANGYNN